MYGLLFFIISGLAAVLEWLIIIRVLLSWINPNRYNPLIIQIYKLTDPILKPFQGLVPTYKIGFDLSPIFALLAIKLVERVLLMFLSGLFF